MHLLSSHDCIDPIQWNPSNVDTLGPCQSVLIRGMCLFQGWCLYTQVTLGTAHSVRITVDVRTSVVPARLGSTVIKGQN